MIGNIALNKEFQIDTNNIEKMSNAEALLDGLEEISNQPLVKTASVSQGQLVDLFTNMLACLSMTTSEESQEIIQ